MVLKMMLRNYHPNIVVAPNCLEILKKKVIWTREETVKTTFFILNELIQLVYWYKTYGWHLKRIYICVYTSRDQKPGVHVRREDAR